MTLAKLRRQSIDFPILRFTTTNLLKHSAKVDGSGLSSLDDDSVREDIFDCFCRCETCPKRGHNLTRRDSAIMDKTTAVPEACEKL
jgi:hypothetical protein